MPAGDNSAALNALVTRLRDGVTVAVDTNILVGARALDTFVMKVKNANLRLRREVGHPQRIRLVVPTLVHAERLHDLRSRWSESYSAEAIAASLRAKGIELEPFGNASAHIHSAFPDATSWQFGKRQNAILQLGLNEAELSKRGVVIPGQRCSATVDWFIAGQARHHGWILISADRGVEFAGLQRVTLTEVEEALDRLVVEDSRSPAS
jgi:hypothetical protein